MSNLHLPAELLDVITDLLHDSRDTLMSCCLVSKSWIPRTRNHLFADIAFHLPSHLQSWKTMFPEPSTSPARYTKSLTINYSLAVTGTGADVDGWISSFSHIVRFAIHIDRVDDCKSLVRFYGFSPAIKSLFIAFSTTLFSSIFNFICSFPRLEDLSVNTSTRCSVIEDGDSNEQVQFPGQPVFTGCLKLSLACGMDALTSRLLSLPNGLHFRELDVSWIAEDDVSSTRELIEVCCPTLESLRINGPINERLSYPIDLSKTIKLKDATFTCFQGVKWITTILQTLTRDHRNLQQITLDANFLLYHPKFDDANPENPRSVVGDTLYEAWLELDHLFVQLRESHSIHLKVLCGAPYTMDVNTAEDWVGRLLPELMVREMAELTIVMEGG